MTTIHDLIALKAKYEGKVVKFNKKVNHWESDYDAGMQARVIYISQMTDDPTVVKVVTDCVEFLAENRKYMSANYYNKNGGPALTWEQSANFPKTGLYMNYFMLTGRDSLDDLTEIVEGEHSAEWKAGYEAGRQAALQEFAEAAAGESI